MVLIPYDAVYYDNTGSYVYLSVDGKAVKTYVTTDLFDDTQISITEGNTARRYRDHQLVSQADERCGSHRTGEGRRVGEAAE